MKTIIGSIKRWFSKPDDFALVPVESCFVATTQEIEIYRKANQVLKEVKDCRIVSWDLWEMDDKCPPQMAISDFNINNTNCAIVNNRIKYCATKDEFIPEMMGLSLAHEIVEMKVVKSMDGTRGIIMVLLCVNGEGKTNIGADLIDLLTSVNNIA